MSEVSEPAIVVTGAWLSSNKGSMAMLAVLRRLIRERFPHGRVTLLSKHIAEDSRYAAQYDYRLVAAPQLRMLYWELPWLAFYRILRHPRWLRVLLQRFSSVLRAVLDADVILDVGGITFSDERGLAGLVINLSWALLGIWSGKPTVKLSQALGPMKRRITRIGFRYVAPRLYRILPRGEISRGYMKSIAGLDEPVAADLGFLLEPSSEGHLFGTIPTDVQRILRGSQTIVIVPSSVIENRWRKAGLVPSYECFQADLARKLLESGLAEYVLFVPHCFRENMQTTNNNDAPVVRRIEEVIDDRARILTLIGDYEPAQLKRLFGYVSLVVSSRFHGMVSALGAGTPTVTIGWSHKYQEVLDMFGLGEFCVDWRDADVENTLAKIRQLYDALEQHRARIASALPQVRMSALRNQAVLEEAVLEARKRAWR